MKNKKNILLAVLAHPDDAELRCFGTLCKYMDMGYECIVIIVCNGENGVSLEKQEITSSNIMLKQKRIQEAFTAFKDSGIKLETLGLDDGNLEFNRNLIVEIERKLRFYEPEIIITHYPDMFGVDHQDHYSVGKATINCATRAEYVKKVLLAEPLMTLRSGFIPNFYVDITKYFNKKIKALTAHKSQYGRYYLEEEYQKTKAEFYSASVGYISAKERRKYEAFQSIHILED